MRWTSLAYGLWGIRSLVLAAVAALVAAGCSEGSQGAGPDGPMDGGMMDARADAMGGERSDAGDDAGDGDDAMPPDASASCQEGTPALEADDFDPCNKDNCSNAVCLPGGVLSDSQKERLGMCEDGSYCVPNELVEGDTSFVPETCRSLVDAEGRCLSTCIPQIRDQADMLPKSSCDDGELCAPCYHPVTGDATGACTATACDSPKESKKTFADCCNGNGLCVPTRLVPDAQQGNLPQGSCADNQLCAPKNVVDDQGNIVAPPTCTSLADGPGRCLPECVPQVQEQADRLPQGMCSDGHLCAPCHNPVSGNETPACTIGDDTPPETPTTFADCCNGNGLCVPSDLVPEGERDNLPTGSCSSGHLCAPKNVLDDQGNLKAPPICDSVDGAEGRCLPECLPEVQQQADQLPQGMCSDGHLCAPCFNPVSGDQTPACTIGDDMPVGDPSTFNECCSGNGLCVPQHLVPETQRGNLAQGGCSSEHLCAPKNVLDDQGNLVAPPMCTSLAEGPGRCLPECVPQVNQQADKLPQGMCSDGHLCAPCHSPISGDETPACTIGDDMPPETATTFEECCNGTSLCVPTDLVPEAQRGNLSQAGCSSDYLCTPKNVLDGQGNIVAPPTCSSIDGAEGRCLPECVPEVQQQADRLPQASCEDGHLCAPCYNPVSGEQTPACTIGDDAPTEDPYTFPECCNGTSLCVPTNLVPEAQRSNLGQGGCSSDHLCTPKNVLDDQGNIVAPPTCDSLAGAPGRCLPMCVPEVSAQADLLEQSSCQDGHLCAPCYDPRTGEQTAACTIDGDMPPSECEMGPNLDTDCTFKDCFVCTEDGTQASTEDGMCVPENLVGDTNREKLSQNSCGSGFLCAPKVIAKDQENGHFKRCSSWLGSGACVPGCFVDSGQRGLLSGDPCDKTNYLCAPCSSILTGCTGACQNTEDECSGG